MNSARVAGGFAPFPIHSTLSEPQSPVRQENLPVASCEQWVRPQNRPPQEAGAEMVLDSPAARTKPVMGSGETPALERIPGQTV